MREFPSLDAILGSSPGYRRRYDNSDSDDYRCHQGRCRLSKAAIDSFKRWLHRARFLWTPDKRLDDGAGRWSKMATVAEKERSGQEFRCRSGARPTR
jgi:hypothetical protein